MTFVNQFTPPVDGDNHRLAEFAKKFAVVAAPANRWPLRLDVPIEEVAGAAA